MCYTNNATDIDAVSARRLFGAWFGGLSGGAWVARVAYAYTECIPSGGPCSHDDSPLDESETKRFNLILNVGIYVTTNVGIYMTANVGIYMTTNVGIYMTTNVRPKCSDVPFFLDITIFWNFCVPPCLTKVPFFLGVNNLR